MVCTELVVARYREDLSWLIFVPDDILVTVYDKSNSPISSSHASMSAKRRLFGAQAWAATSLRPAGARVHPICVGMFRDPSVVVVSTEEVEVPTAGGARTETMWLVTLEGAGTTSLRGEPLTRRIAVKRLTNVGREADTYLKHVIANYGDALADQTIFCQGDPFEHSPKFLKLLSLDARARYTCPVQALTDRWMVQRDIPPQRTLDAMHSAAAPQPLGVLTHPFSMYTLDTICFHDPGAHHVRSKYESICGCDAGTNLVAHFLQSVGCRHAPPPGAKTAELCFGAIFAVARSHILRNDKLVYERLSAFNNEHGIGPYMLERCWMAIFGMDWVG